MAGVRAKVGAGAEARLGLVGCALRVASGSRELTLIVDIPYMLVLGTTRAVNSISSPRPLCLWL